MLECILAGQKHSKGLLEGDTINADHSVDGATGDDSIALAQGALTFLMHGDVTLDDGTGSRYSPIVVLVLLLLQLLWLWNLHIIHGPHSRRYWLERHGRWSLQASNKSVCDHIDSPWFLWHEGEHSHHRLKFFRCINLNQNWWRHLLECAIQPKLGCFVTDFWSHTDPPSFKREFP